MGLEIGDNGKLIKWSDLFDYSSPKLLQVSTWLPTPRHINIYNNSDDIDIPQYNITKQLQDIAPYITSEDEQYKVTKLRKVADLIIDIYNNIGNSEDVNLVYDDKYSVIAKQVIHDLRIHERTKISPSLEESAYKNSVSCKIGNIVQHLSNMALAYSPITMADLQQLAAESEKGALVASMSLMNPLTKYLMQVQNMVGKKVIGIGAVGEKVFFNLSYYYNEGVRSGDDKWIRNLQFHKEFNRIQGRYKYTKGEGKLSQIIKTSLANVNFDNFEHVRSRFLIVSQVDDQLRKEYGITDIDIDQQTQKWQQYRQELNNLFSNKASQESLNKFASIHKEITRCYPVDLLISQLLSAATDNAKELILAKINCGDQLAKCHLYLLMLGFDIKDVVSFMISPCVSFISDMSEANMMDSYVTNLKIDDSIKIAEGIINPSNFIFGSVTTRDPNGNLVEISRMRSILGTLLSTSLGRNLVSYKMQQDPEFKKFTNLQEFIQAYINARVEGINIELLENFSNKFSNESKKEFNIMSDYIEKIIYRLNKTIDKYAERYTTVDPRGIIDDDTMQIWLEDQKQARDIAIQEFREDLQEFKNIYQLANETTTLGGVFLGMNQGLPSSKVDLQNKLRKISDAISTREDIFEIKKGVFEGTIGQVQDINKAIKNQQKRITKIFNKLIDNNQFIISGQKVLEDGSIDPNSDYMFTTLERATAFDIIGNFDVEKWLYDIKLTKDDIINNTFYGVTIDINKVMQGQDSISYRELVSDYYNTIKGTWNIFDMMDKIPQYKEIINLLKTVYTMDKYSSIKSSIVNRLFDEVYKETKFIDDQQNKDIITYVNDLLITSYFRQYNKSFPIYEGMQYLDELYNTKIAKSNRLIDLNNAPGRASFKKVFESIISQLQTTGKYGEAIIPDYSTNQFIQGLRIVYDKYEVPRISMELDMMKTDSTPSSQKLFQEYLNGFYKLKDVKINGTSLSDWFILYNLFVNQNSYGSDKLTTIFKNQVANKNSILEHYFQFIGKLDYQEITDEVLKDLEYNIDDLLIRIAPYVSRSEELRSTRKFIKVKRWDGEIVTKKYNPIYNSYREIPQFIAVKSELDSSDDNIITNDQRSNYSQYQMIPMRTQDFNISLREGLMSDSLDVLIHTLQEYSRRGLIQIFKENC